MHFVFFETQCSSYSFLLLRPPSSTLIWNHESPAFDQDQPLLAVHQTTEAHCAGEQTPVPLVTHGTLAPFSLETVPLQNHLDFQEAENLPVVQQVVLY